MLHWLGCQAVSGGACAWMARASSVCLQQALPQVCAPSVPVSAPQGKACGVARAAQGTCQTPCAAWGQSSSLTLTAPVLASVIPWEHGVGRSLQLPRSVGRRQGVAGLRPLWSICLGVEGAEVSAHGWWPCFANRATKESNFCTPSSIWTVGGLFQPQLKLLYPCL